MFFQKNKNINDDLSKVAALLIHAARIDQNYSITEEEIIKKTLREIGANNENVSEIINNGKKIEENSNQILDFTKEVKNMEETTKAIKQSCEDQKKGITTFIEVILNQELGEPFRRDAMKKPVRVAGIKKEDMKAQKNLN